MAIPTTAGVIDITSVLNVDWLMFEQGGESQMAIIVDNAVRAFRLIEGWGIPMQVQNSAQGQAIEPVRQAGQLARWASFSADEVRVLVDDPAGPWSPLVPYLMTVALLEAAKAVKAPAGEYEQLEAKLRPHVPTGALTDGGVAHDLRAVAQATAERTARRRRTPPERSALATVGPTSGAPGVGHGGGSYQGGCRDRGVRTASATAGGRGLQAASGLLSRRSRTGAQHTAAQQASSTSSGR